jgi:hypothetical protein
LASRAGVEPPPTGRRPSGQRFPGRLGAIDVARQTSPHRHWLAAEALDRARARGQAIFGGTVDLATIQFMLADVETDVAGRLLYRYAAERLGGPGQRRRRSCEALCPTPPAADHARGARRAVAERHAAPALHRSEDARWWTGRPRSSVVIARELQ